MDNLLLGPHIQPRLKYHLVLNHVPLPALRSDQNTMYSNFPQNNLHCTHLYHCPTLCHAVEYVHADTGEIVVHFQSHSLFVSCRCQDLCRLGVHPSLHVSAHVDTGLLGISVCTLGFLVLSAHCQWQTLNH